jgi:hypothetical protein
MPHKAERRGYGRGCLHWERLIASSGVGLKNTLRMKSRLRFAPEPTVSDDWPKSANVIEVIDVGGAA